jgi:Protein of unknown function (DUF2635)
LNTEKTYVKPASERNVIDPATGLALPPEGKEVERTTYWIRRKNEGDVTEGYPAPTQAKKTKE